VEQRRPRAELRNRLTHTIKTDARCAATGVRPAATDQLRACWTAVSIGYRETGRPYSLAKCGSRMPAQPPACPAPSQRLPGLYRYPGTAPGIAGAPVTSAIALTPTARLSPSRVTKPADFTSSANDVVRAAISPPKLPMVEETGQPSDTRRRFVRRLIPRLTSMSHQRSCTFPPSSRGKEPPRTQPSNKSQASPRSRSGRRTPRCVAPRQTS